MKPVSPVLKHPAFQMPETLVAKDQPEYDPMPAMVSRGQYGMVTTRWKPSLIERLILIFGGSVYVQMMRFGKGVTPIKVMVDEPPIDQCCL